MTFSNKSLTAIACTLCILFTLQCDSTEINTELDFNLLGSTAINDYTVELYSENNLITGTNTLYWAVLKDGNRQELESFRITPMMDMGTMQHSTPFTQPKESPDFSGYYYNDATFIMASGEMGGWEINFEFETKTAQQVSGSIDITVESSWHLTSAKSSSDQMYFITWSTPKNPTNGSNDVAFMLYKRENMMSFPMVIDATITIYPYMDMGSGQGHSTSFENPTVTNNGSYTGNITYSMSGTWTTAVTVVTAEKDTLPEVVFEYNVQAK